MTEGVTPEAPPERGRGVMSRRDHSSVFEPVRVVRNGDMGRISRLICG